MIAMVGMIYGCRIYGCSVYALVKLTELEQFGGGWNDIFMGVNRAENAMFNRYAVSSARNIHKIRIYRKTKNEREQVSIQCRQSPRNPHFRTSTGPS